MVSVDGELDLNKVALAFRDSSRGARATLSVLQRLSLFAPIFREGLWVGFHPDLQTPVVSE